MSFNPTRLTLARKRRGINKIKLAELLDLTTRSITAYESGEKKPSPETLLEISRQLDFPVGFFSGADPEMPSAQTASFRSMARMSAAQRDAALGAGAIAFTLNDWIENKFQLPNADLLDLRGEDPEAAAAALRHYWELGERPIKNMVHLLEAKGVRVYSLEERVVEVDAFSLWRKDSPFIFLNTQKSTERSRFDAAHELGHLVLHKHGGPAGQDAEQQADTFASAFLMPKASIIATAPRMPTLSHLVLYKKNWLVSVAAILYRLNKLNLITEWHYRSLCIQLSEAGYRSVEPDSAPRETSQILAKIFLSLRESSLNKSHIADDLNIGIGELDKLVFGLAVISLEGGSYKNISNSKKPNLTVVK